MLDHSLLSALLRRASGRGADFAEVFVERRSSRSLAAEDGRVDQATGGTQHGAGICVVCGGTTVFAFTEELTEASLLEAVDTVTSAARSQPEETVLSIDLTQRHCANPSPVYEDPRQVPMSAKVAMLEQADRAARAVDPCISQVSAVYFESHHLIQIANTRGVLAEDERCRVRVRVQAIATRAGRASQGFGSWGPGETGGFERFAVLPSPASVGAEAARQALVLLEAGPAPAGRMPLVITNGVGGILFHEACGHGLEGDVVTRAGSIYAGRLGQMVASPAVTAIDSGVVPNAWGSGTFDDEGNPCQRTVLIAEGRLESYMHDAASARRDGVAPTGNGRRASFRHLPMPRMTNTYIDNGPYTPEQVLAATDNGIYARNFGGGVADMATGTFSFTIREGYVIRNGRLDYPVTGVAVVGNGPDALANVDMVANDLALAPVICGKDGQKAMVCVGQPTLRVSSVTIGGAAKERMSHA